MPWYRLIRGVPTVVGDDEAYAHRGSCYNSWAGARADAIAMAERALFELKRQHIAARRHLDAMRALPVTAPSTTEAGEVTL